MKDQVTNKIEDIMNHYKKTYRWNNEEIKACYKKGLVVIH